MLRFCCEFYYILCFMFVMELLYSSISFFFLILLTIFFLLKVQRRNSCLLINQMMMLLSTSMIPMMSTMISCDEGIGRQLLFCGCCYFCWICCYSVKNWRILWTRKIYFWRVLYLIFYLCWLRTLSSLMLFSSVKLHVPVCYCKLIYSSWLNLNGIFFK